MAGHSMGGAVALQLALDHPEIVRSLAIACDHALVRWDVRSRLGEIRCPVLVVSSDKDPLPLADKQALAAGVPRGRLVTIERSRHVPLWDQPERLNEILLGFFAQS